jgi:hypothetical protein
MRKSKDQNNMLELPIMASPGGPAIPVTLTRMVGVGVQVELQQRTGQKHAVLWCPGALR